MLVSELRSQMILTLNEETVPVHFEDPVILNAIAMALATVGAITKFGIQKTINITTDGTSKLPITESIISVVRVNKAGDCGLTELTSDQADKLKSGWRGCEHQEGEVAAHFIIEDDEAWIFPIPAPGTAVSVTVNTAAAELTDNIPVNILAGVRHFALQYCYERLYGSNHGNAAYHNQHGYKFLLARESNYGQL